ncbi:MAG: cytochrome c1, partial [Alphaproteobacteria bacterium]
MRLLAIASLLALVLTSGAQAAGGGDTARKHPEPQFWTFTGPFGTFDRQQLQRGYQVY